MEPFRIGKAEINFTVVTGVILDSNKYSETHISSSGGGGHVGRDGGYVDAPQIHSQVLTHHEFWVQLPDGREWPIKLVNADMPLRTGQNVTLVYGGIGRKEGYLLMLMNHNSGQHWLFSEKELVKTAIPWSKFWISWLAIIVIIMVIPNIAIKPLLPMGSVFLFFVSAWVFSGIYSQAYIDRLRQYLNDMAANLSGAH